MIKVESLDCKRFQKVAGADLSALDQDLLEHAEVCSDCDHFLEEAKRFDLLLSAAIKVDVPDVLEANLLNIADKPSAAFSSGGSSRAPRFMALAASVLLIVGGSFMANKLLLQPSQPLEQVVLSHIESEPKMLTLASFTPAAQVQSQLLNFGVRLTEPLRHVSHLELCDIGDTQGLHIVMKGEKGPITLLLLPTVKSETVRSFSEGRWTGYIKPAEQGTIAIVAELGEPLDEINHSLLNTIHWL
jgi:hypothetical protein